MAATISANSAGGGGLVTSGDASGVLALQTAGVTALSIDTSQKVTFTNSLTSPTLTTPVINSATVATVSGTAPLYMCRAWVNFNGVGTVAIRASGNVSSITDNGVGDYTVNFATAMPDANYQADVTAPSYSTTNNTVLAMVYGSATVGAATLKSTTQLRVAYGNSAGLYYDPAEFYVSIIR